MAYWSSMLLLLLLLALLVEVGGAKCGWNDTAIRFPFGLKHDQDQSAYPGFELSCRGEHTVLEFPKLSLKFFVQDIDYRAQRINLYDPDNCIKRKLLEIPDLPSISPFLFAGDELTSYSLFNCSIEGVSGLYYKSRSCLAGPGYLIYYAKSQTAIEDLPLYCSKLNNFTTPFLDVLDNDNDDNELILRWLEPNCKHCEENGKSCRLNNPTNLKSIECFHHEDTTLGAAVLTVVLILVYHARNSNKQATEHKLRIERFLEDYNAMKPSRYTHADIKRMTSQFREKLGEGAYGTVYKGELSADVLVAVKILNNSKGNGEEFINEVGTIGRIHHVNVVRLVGYCADGANRALVYEFLPNGSLQQFISSPDSVHFLGWEKLKDITLGIAKGIEYLHQGCDQRILHFDIKPQNVLLDDNFTPKISDFGLAKLCSKDQSIVSITTARGTMGYIAPEVFSRNFGMISYKSDIYSFGIMLLEMVGGKKITDVKEEVYYPEWIYNLLEEGEDLVIHIDKEEDTKIAKKLAIVGLWCIQWHPTDRPSMKVVVQMLEREEKLTLPPNPFASTDSTKTVVDMPRRRMNLDLETITELE
ncbi:rust resistance kinase Lr10-like isoform X2 [Humulus lupulus]|uniref:rust resistance kinase Lr10-like isoform X2 n=1 Tax=Humulus lupulus TaxID=3486 RepID=UPI002B4127EC|nr:rust resistance kinase Lr10-like isoform X2 [Humulus lupulus]